MTDKVMLPKEATEEMLRAARDWSIKKYGKPIGSEAAIGCYAAMLAAPPAGKVSRVQVEAAAEGFATAMNFTWRCDCIAQLGLDCDCGTAMSETREPHDEEWSRDCCRLAARAVIRALGLEVEDG